MSRRPTVASRSIVLFGVVTAVVLALSVLAVSFVRRSAVLEPRLELAGSIATGPTTRPSPSCRRLNHDSEPAIRESVGQHPLAFVNSRLRGKSGLSTKRIAFIRRSYRVDPHRGTGGPAPELVRAHHDPRGAPSRFSVTSGTLPGPRGPPSPAFP